MVGVEPPGPLHEQTPIGGHHCLPIEQMGERAPICARGMRPLGRLVELLWVPEQDQRCRCL